MIAGYAIVRNPLFEESYPGGGLMSPFLNLYYHGIKRSMWEDVEDYLSTSSLLDKKILEAYEAIKNDDRDGTFIKTVKDLKFAKQLINLDSEIARKNEIIAMSSSYLNQIKKVEDKNPVIWLGYDIVLLGGWSLLRHGVFENKLFSLLEKSTNINKYGLFDNLNYLDGFLTEYKRLSALDKVDPIIENLRVDFIRVGIIKQ